MSPSKTQEILRFSIHLPVVPSPTLGVTIRWEWTFLNNILSKLFILPPSAHTGLCRILERGVCMVFACVERERELSVGQSMARDWTPQPNNIHNIHQICIHYLAEILSIPQMCMWVCMKGTSL